MRKKKNLFPRLNAVSEILAETPEDLRERIGSNPIWLELGCGMGSFLSQSAKRDPDVFFVGFERVREAIVVAAERAETSNIVFALRDAAELDAWFVPGSIERLFIHFCDPWHKKRHAKRRLTYRTFLRKYAVLLSKTGELVFKTDNTPLFEFTVEELAAEGWEITSLSMDWHTDPSRDTDEPMTEYESKFSICGQAISRLTARPGGA
jgi:tRNA (guanine-N7-)-methyltransferase